MKTYLSTDWIDVHNGTSTYMARVFLTGEDEAYMITVQDGRKKFFRVDSKVLRLGEIGFFEKVMKSAEELQCMPTALKGQ